MKKTYLLLLLSFCLAFRGNAQAAQANNATSGVPIPFEGLADYPEGTICSTVYNAGPGLAVDRDATTPEDSKEVVIGSTTSTTFNNYVQTLLESGFTQISSRTIDSNVFYTLSYNNKLYYLYFSNSLKQVRIIQDNSTRTLLANLDATAQGTGKTEFYLYSLDYTQGVHTFSLTDYWQLDCGAMIIIKLADNSLFIVDAGHPRQCSNAAIDGLMDFMYRITGQARGTAINIRAWFFSHAHGDHVYMAYPFITKYHDALNVEGVLFNFPSYRVMSSGYDIVSTVPMKQVFNTYYPNCKYAKLHTGQGFTLQGVGFDVLHTHEDDVNYSTGKTNIGDFNETSTILKITMDGKKFMLLADANSICQNDVVPMFSASTLKSDCVQTAHHCYNAISTFYYMIKAPLALVCNSSANVSKSGISYTGVTSATSNVKVIFADPDTYKITVVNGELVTETVPSYRSYFTTVNPPDLVENSNTPTGNIVDLNTLLSQTSLNDQVIDKSVTGTAAIATTNNSGTQQCSLVLDGSTSTMFQTNTIPATIAWTMKKPVTLKGYVIYTGTDNSANNGRNPNKWVLYGSNDAVNWTGIDSVCNPNLPEEDKVGTAFGIANPLPYQYYTLKVFSSSGSEYLQFSEIGLYGEASGTGVKTVAAKKKFQIAATNTNLSIGGFEGGESVRIFTPEGKLLLLKNTTKQTENYPLGFHGVYIVGIFTKHDVYTCKIMI